MKRQREVKGNGRYDYDMDALCVCGHTYGEHLAIRSKFQACTAYSQVGTCPCTCFKKSK